MSKAMETIERRMVDVFDACRSWGLLSLFVGSLEKRTGHL